MDGMKLMSIETDVEFNRKKSYGDGGVVKRQATDIVQVVITTLHVGGLGYWSFCLPWSNKAVRQHLWRQSSPI